MTNPPHPEPALVQRPAAACLPAAGLSATDPPVLAWPELRDRLAASPGLLPDGTPAVPALFVNLDAPGPSVRPPGPPERLPVPSSLWSTVFDHQIVIGLAQRAVRPELIPLTETLTCTLVASSGPVAGGRDLLPPAQVAVADLNLAGRAIAATVAAAPKAAATLAGLLRLTSAIPVEPGLVAESLAYSMLLAGPEFARWLAARPPRPPAPVPAEPVLLDRSGDELHVTLNDPARHNCFSRHVRDGLIEALDLALADPSITTVRLDGRGPSFCSGGDLCEFGTTPDVATAHLIRLDRSVPARANRCRDHLRPVLHGACIGAGIEIPSFATHVEARDDAFFQLPELAMGLIPGAGGTVSLPRRLGRWRTAYLALSGTRIDLPAALAWGLVDARVSA